MNNSTTQSSPVFLHALNTIPGIGPATLSLLKKQFGSFERAWTVSRYDLESIHIAPSVIDALITNRSTVNPERLFAALEDEGIWIATENDASYPNLLREIHQPPVIIYGRGERNALQTNGSRAIAVVGTRTPTSYGRHVTEHLVTDLAHNGVIIVSGLALGIDGYAHRAALEAGAITIAVLGSGVDDKTIFPSSHRGLASSIITHAGAVISEFPPHTPAMKTHFPQRNRIIAGLAHGTLVIEARKRSGALITARFALEQNRDVFAVPSSIFSTVAEGTHQLIKEGAALVTDAADIFNTLGIAYTTGQHHNRMTFGTSSNPETATLLSLLGEPLTVDAMKEKTSIPTSQLIAALSFLELEGKIRRLGGDAYERIA